MNATCSRIRDEMAVFADLGTPVPKVSQSGKTLVVRMFRNGEEITLDFHECGTGKVVERCGSSSRTHASYVALLASERFGDLRRWARTQSMLLRESLKDICNAGIRIEGSLSASSETLDYTKLDEFLASKEHRDGSVKVMLIEGPAGIGKTKFIEMIALSRAATYTKARRPLVLHVQSRGRVLSHLQDLMAFSLQRLRLAVTFDQLPVLAKHGLVTLAIDGFDELGDPNGYDLAWGQVNETIVQLRGHGTLLLAGRETFIGLERLRTTLRELREQDTIDGLTLQPPSAEEAKRWLGKNGWSRDDMRRVSHILDAESYALRPFFLAQLADKDMATSVRRPGTGLLSILVESMLERESRKFGDAVDVVLDDDKRRQYAHMFLREVAQFMADDQTDIIDETCLTWLVDVALPDAMDDPDIVGLLRNRAGSMAFLANDLLPGYRRFSHSQLFNYFLSVAVIDLVSVEEIPKFVHRNIFSADFLAVFIDVLRHIANVDPARAKEFFDGACEWVRNYPSIDRGARNLGAWLLASLSTIADITESEAQLRAGPFDVDETIIKGTMPSVLLRGVAVNQLDIRGADLRGLTFDGCTVNTALVDDGTRVSGTFPTPQRIRRQNIGTKRGDDEWVPSSIDAWLDAHGRLQSTDEAKSPEPDPNSRHGRMLRLVERACRSPSFWIPEDAQTRVDGFVEDPLWPEALDLLKEHHFIREERFGASGTRDRFVHIKHCDRILAQEPADEDVARFYEAVAGRALNG